MTTPGNAPRSASWPHPALDTATPTVRISGRLGSAAWTAAVQQVVRAAVASCRVLPYDPARRTVLPRWRRDRAVGNGCAAAVRTDRWVAGDGCVLAERRGPEQRKLDISLGANRLQEPSCPMERDDVRIGANNGRTGPIAPQRGADAHFGLQRGDAFFMEQGAATRVGRVRTYEKYVRVGWNRVLRQVRPQVPWNLPTTAYASVQVGEWDAVDGSGKGPRARSAYFCGRRTIESSSRIIAASSPRRMMSRYAS